MVIFNWMKLSLYVNFIKKLNIHLSTFQRAFKQSSWTQFDFTSFSGVFRWFPIWYRNQAAEINLYIEGQATSNFSYQYENRFSIRYKKIKNFQFFFKALNQKSGPDKLLVFSSNILWYILFETFLYTQKKSGHRYFQILLFN